MNQLVSTLIELCDLRPSRVEDGKLIVTDGVIRHTLVIAKDKYDKTAFGWTVFAEDEAFREAMIEFGGIGVEIWRPPSAHRAGLARHQYSYGWPSSKSTIDPALLEDISRYAPSALSFVTDRTHLGELLLSGEDVHRGLVWADLRSGTEPARLVKAIILARHMSDAKLETVAVAKLRREAERDLTWIPGQPYLFRQAVADWAKQYASSVDVNLHDLTLLKRRRV